MMIRLRSSITLKMAALVAGGTSLVFTLVLAYSYAYSRKLILQEAESNARNLTLSVARRIEQEFRAVEKVPRNLAALLETTRVDREALQALLLRAVEDNSEVFGAAVGFEPRTFDPAVEEYSVYWCRSEGGMKFVELSAGGYRYRHHDWYQIAQELAVPYWSQPYFDEGGGNVLMTTYSYPLFDKGIRGSVRRVKGVITADVSLSWLGHLVSSIQVGRTGYCFIISDTGTFVTHPNAALVTRESLFSLAEEAHDPQLRELGRTLVRSSSGFEDSGRTLVEEEAFVAHARISATGWVLGAVFPKSELLEEVSALHRTTVVLAALGVLLLALVAMVVSRSISMPLRRMAKATARVAQGDLNVDLSEIRSTDEVGQLAYAFTRMTEGLKDRDFIRNTFGRYLTKEVVNRLLESKDGLRLGGESREITLLMSDLRGFTALTSHMNAEQVITFLNRYLGRMIEILVDYRGNIDEIIGDGILAFFGAPEPLEDHPARAVACALKMQAAMQEINALNEADGLPHLEMGAAVHTGEVVVGNIGSETRSKYGAVGFQVNFTGRVESFTVGSQVLISEATYERLSDILSVREVLNVEMKGVPGNVSLYDVRGIGGPYAIQLEERDEAPLSLPQEIGVQIHRVQEKAIARPEIRSLGVITRLSRTGATLRTSQHLNMWEDIKLHLLDDQSEPLLGEVYGKVVSVTHGVRDYDAVMRFTSISPEAYSKFRAELAKLSGPER
jgi:class 3 adenylate cyclase